jgi:hypothetical protein
VSDFNVEVFAADASAGLSPEEVFKVRASREQETALAKLLHEAGASAVKNGASVNPYGDCYDGWEDITEAAREGRRMQARWLMERGIGLVGRASPKAVPPRIDVSEKK